MKKQCPKTHGRLPAVEPVAYSVYIGRKRLGRFVQIDKREFDAFDVNDTHLGNFRTRKEALNAIDAASDERA